MTPTTKKALIISGAALGAIAVGFLGYKLYIRLTKDVIEGKHNTILVEKEEPTDVEVVSFDEEERGTFNEWTSDDWAAYYGAPELTAIQENTQSKDDKAWEDYWAEYYGAPMS